MAWLATPASTAPFAEDQIPRHGIFHAGWSLLVRASVAGLDADRDPGAVAEVAVAADEVATAFRDAIDAGRSPFLEAYPGQSWPVDSVVAVAALLRADTVTGGDHRALVDDWVEAASEHLDPRTGLLPHSTDPRTGEPLETARGTSQSIIQRLWPEVDPESASDGYRRFREHFATSTAGFVGVREHPVGLDGPGDVDSGPLVLGYSASASAVTIGAARANGDPALAAAIVHEADTFGVPLTVGGERRYLFGAMPIGDAFVAWARAAPEAPPAPDLEAMGATWAGYLALPWLVVGGLWLLVARRRARHHIGAARPAPSGS